jgi:hypothetical protein
MKKLQEVHTNGQATIGVITPCGIVEAMFAWF